jgi:two-component system sensor histidine kinase CpxA
MNAVRKPRVRTRSLFIKLFIWFWLALALANITSFVVFELTRPQPFNPPFRAHFRNSLTIFAQGAAESYDNGGQAALEDFLDRVEQSTDIKVELYDENGRVLSKKRGVPGGKDLALRLLNSPGNEPPRSFVGGPSLGRVATGPSGKKYALVTTNPERGPFGPGYKVQAMQLLALILTGGILCYWLARYLTSPISKLRATTQTIASGDLTARVGPSLGKRRDELTALGHDFDVMAERIEALLISQRRLLGDISHELRSPLARLNVALGLARDGRNEDRETALLRIEQEAETINDLIGQMLMLSRLESGALNIRAEAFNLDTLVQQVADDADFEAYSRDCSVVVTHSQECEIQGSIDLIHSAIENVVRNAIRYTAPGSEVNVSLYREHLDGNEFALIRVRDHGPGVPTHNLNDIFRPFFRVGDARDRESGGTGLGLAITARAVKLHGGAVTAMNHPDGGFIVEISLPLKPQNGTLKDFETVWQDERVNAV